MAISPSVCWQTVIETTELTKRTDLTSANRTYVVRQKFHEEQKRIFFSPNFDSIDFIHDVVRLDDDVKFYIMLPRDSNFSFIFNR